tara:strand:- start:7043 stop:7201 length:159 start_codon:yes stop_codon:yes gene_type:complete
MRNKTKEKKYIPEFNEWYDENSRERYVPYEREEGRKVYNRLIKEKYDFPFWN